MQFGVRSKNFRNENIFPRIISFFPNTKYSIAKNSMSSKYLKKKRTQNILTAFQWNVLNQFFQNSEHRYILL